MESDNQSSTSENQTNEIQIPHNYQLVDDSCLLDPLNLIKTNKEICLFELPKNVIKIS